MFSWGFLVVSSSCKWDLGSWHLCHAVPHLGLFRKTFSFYELSLDFIVGLSLHTSSLLPLSAHIQMWWVPSQCALFYSLLCLEGRTTCYARPMRAMLKPFLHLDWLEGKSPIPQYHWLCSSVWASHQWGFLTSTQGSFCQISFPSSLYFLPDFLLGFSAPTWGMSWPPTLV